MNKRIKIILTIASILILLGIKYVFAASGSFSVNKSAETLEIGKTVTFSITATNCGGKFVITSSNTNIASISSGEEWIENTSKEITITAKSAGTAIITIKAEDVATSDSEPEEVTGTQTITITVPEEKVDNNNQDTGSTGGTTNNNTQTDTPTTTTPEEPKKSSEARLSNFGIKPNDVDFTGFKRDKYEYSTEVPNDVAEVEIYANVIKNSNATVEGTGKVQLKEGNNTFEVKVTAEDGKTTKTYKLTIKRQTAEETAKEASEARLSNLGIKPEEYDFSGFSKDKTEYTAEVPNEVEEIEVYAKAIDSKAQITGTGMIELKEGENEIKIEVIAQNGEKKAYTIKVTRKVAEKTEEPVETEKDAEKFGLSTLTITGITLNKKFDSKTYEYSVELTEDIASLPISAKATDKDATVEIIGNENFKLGENIITILVQNAKTEETATYQIIVNKKVEEETIRTSWLKPSTWGKEEIIKIAMVVVIIILIIIAVILKIQIAKDNKKEKKVDFPGADALDKALAEHQELNTEEQLDGGNVADNNNYIEELAINSAIDDMQQENTENEVAEEAKEAFSISEATKGEVKKFLEEFPQGEVEEVLREVNENLEVYEEKRASVDDLFNDDELDVRPRRRGRGKHF